MAKVVRISRRRGLEARSLKRLREHAPELEALAQDTGLSATTLSRVAADRKLGGRLISPAELARALGLTEPSARRLLRTLTSHSLAIDGGSAQSSRRGRPAHLFRLLLASDEAEELLRVAL